MASKINYPFAAIITITTSFLVSFPTFFHTSEHREEIWEDISLYGHVSSQGVIVGLSLIALIAVKKHRASSLCNLVAAAFRIAAFHTGHLIAITYFFRLVAVVITVNEYFITAINTWIVPKSMKEPPPKKWQAQGDNYLVEDPTFQYSPETDSSASHSVKFWMTSAPLSSSQSVPLLGHADENKEKTIRLFVSLEWACIAMIAVCSIGVGVTIDTDSMIENIGFMLSKSPLFGFSVALIVIQILKVQKAVSFGAQLFSGEHSNSLIFALLAGGIFVRGMIDVGVVPLNEILKIYFFDFAADMLTHTTPILFHYYNIFSYNRKSCNAGERMKCSVFVILLLLNLTAVGSAMDTSYDSENTYIPLIACARAAGWASGVNFGFVVLGIMSPISQLLYQYFNFNIMHHTLHTIHFHRNAAICGCFFGALHIALIVTRVSGYTAKDIPFWTVRLVSGIVIAFGFTSAGITGYLSKFKSYTAVSSLHMPFACIGIFGLIAHAYKAVEFPFGSYFVLCIFIACVAIYTLLFFFNPIQPISVNQNETVWQHDDNKFSFLVLNYNNSNSVPPGSFFLVYANQDSNLAYFHAHPFPVFSSRNRRISFLVRNRIPTNQNQISFTQQLSIGNPQTLRLQGPFQGTVSSFINYLSSMQSYADVYLCGWDAGLANIFSILEFLKDNAHLYPISSICCIFNSINETEITARTHTYLNNLVRDWDSLKPVVIIEANERDLNHINKMATKDSFGNKASAMIFCREVFPNRARWLIMRDVQHFDVNSSHVSIPTMFGNKILYFCGSQFQPEKFSVGEWRTFVEAIA